MKKFFITILTLLLLFSFTACGEAKESSPKLKEWSAPEYSDVTYGATVTVLPVSVRDTEENVYNAVVKVQDPDRRNVKLENEQFTANVVGEYTITYTVTAGETTESKSTSFDCIKTYRDTLKEQLDLAAASKSSEEYSAEKLAEIAKIVEEGKTNIDLAADDKGAKAAYDEALSKINAIQPSVPVFGNWELGSESSYSLTENDNGSVTVEREAVPAGEYKSVSVAVSDWVSSYDAFSFRVKNNSATDTLTVRTILTVEEDKDASLGEENIINDWGNATVVTLKAGEAKNITVAVPQSDLLENGLLARVHVRLNANGTQDSTYAVNATLSKPVWETGSELRLGDIAALYYPELFTISGDTVSFDYTDLGDKTYQGVGVSIDNFDKNAHKFFSFEIKNTGTTEIGFDIRLVNDTGSNDTLCKVELKAGETLSYANWVDYIFTNSPDANELTKIEIIVNSGETIAAGVTNGTFVLENIAFTAEGTVLGGSAGYEVLPAEAE